MRLTKRQLRRIIKEEISKSRRRSIREANIGGHEMNMVGSMSHPSLNNPQSLSRDEFHTLKDWMDDWFEPKAIQIILSSSNGQQLWNKAQDYRGDTGEAIGQLQDCAEEMQDQFGWSFDETAEALVGFDQNILRRIMDDNS